MSTNLGKHQMPARGAKEGLRKDLQTAKADSAYNPNGVGNAYSHNFLNQKPWHPANFRNQARVYEAEQKQIQEAKQKEIAKAEFAAEQEFLKTLSYLSPEEQQKFKDRQSVQFMYIKPPGADSTPAAAAKDAYECASASEILGTHQPVEAEKSKQEQSGGRIQTGHLKNMLGAMRALQNHDRWHFKSGSGMGQSPPRGSTEAAAANQQILVSSSEDDVEDAAAAYSGQRKNNSTENQVAEAEAVLKQAGYDIEQLRGLQSSKRKKHKGKKHKRDSKRRKL